MIGLSLVNRLSKSCVAQAVRMLARRLQFHQVDDVDDAHFQFGKVLAEQFHRGEASPASARRRSRP